jgi:hypothetical protein
LLASAERFRDQGYGACADQIAAQATRYLDQAAALEGERSGPMSPAHVVSLALAPSPRTSSHRANNGARALRRDPDSLSPT